MLSLQAVATQAALAAQVHHQVQAAPTLFIPAAYYPAYPVSIPAHHPGLATNSIFFCFLFVKNH